jgi:Protein of unknown function (DUF1822)
MGSTFNLSIPDCPACNEARKEWDLERLWNDLSYAKTELRLTNEGLTERETSVLCALLCRKKPAEIAKMLGRSINDVKDIIYNCLKEYLGFYGENPKGWADFLVIAADKYKKTSFIGILNIAVITSAKELNNSQLKEVEKYIQAMTGDPTIKIKRIEKGSIVLILEGSPDGLERLVELFDSGQLSEILAIPVQDVRLIWDVAEAGVPQKWVNLSQWFENIVETGWQTVEEILDQLATQEPRLVSTDRFGETQVGSATAIDDLIERSQTSQDEFTRLEAAQILARLDPGNQQAIATFLELLHNAQNNEIRRQAAVDLGKINPEHPEAGIRRAKLVDLGLYRVIIAVTLMPLATKVNVHLRVYPTGNQPFVPPLLQLMVLDESGRIFLETRSQEGDDYIQLELTGDKGDRFSVKAALGETSITDHFII